MEVIRIKDASNELYSKALSLYKTSFPIHEQREKESQKEILNNDDYHFDCIIDNGAFIGEILYWEIGNYLYIEHFCVQDEMRNMGYGACILNLYKDKILILEIDPPVDDISVKRKGFYERQGFKENTYRHVHPAYHKGYKGHDLVVMSLNETLSLDEYNIFNDYLKNIVMKNAYKA